MYAIRQQPYLWWQMNHDEPVYAGSSSARGLSVLHASVERLSNSERLSATQWLERSIGENRHVLFFCAVLRNWCRVVLIIMLCRHFRPTICRFCGVFVDFAGLFPFFFHHHFLHVGGYEHFMTFFNFFPWIRFFEAFQKAQGAPKVEGYAQGAASSRPAGSPSHYSGNPCILSELSYRSKETCMRLNEYHMNHVYICVCIQHAGVSHEVFCQLCRLWGVWWSRNLAHRMQDSVGILWDSLSILSILAWGSILRPTKASIFCSKPFLAHSISFIFSILLIFLFKCWWVDFCVLFGLIFPIFLFLLLFFALWGCWRWRRLCESTQSAAPGLRCQRGTGESTIHEMWRAWTLVSRVFHWKSYKRNPSMIITIL